MITITFPLVASLVIASGWIPAWIEECVHEDFLAITVLTITVLSVNVCLGGHKSFVNALQPRLQVQCLKRF